MKKNFLWLSVIALVIGLAVFLKLDLTSDGSSNQTKKIHYNESKIEKSLSMQMSLNVRQDLNVSQKRKLDSIVEGLSKRHFFGAYIALRNDKILFSGSSGVANSITANTFKLDSVTIVNVYQEFIDRAVLLGLIQNRSISLTNKIADYLPELKGKTELTLRELLVHGSDLYVKNKYCTRNSVALEHLGFKGENENNYGSGDSIIIRELISSFNKSGYRSAVNKFIIDSFGLMNTSFYNEEQQQANKVVGYRPKKVNGHLTQGKRIDIDSTELYQNQLTMSISDILVTFRRIASNKLFSKKYDYLFARSINNIAGITCSRENYLISDNNFGQYLQLKSNKNGSHITLLFSNCNNSDVKIGKINRELYSI
ncbi:serine-type D-Ala-D-Ala carboxypeptidase [Lactiplantibacillus plantarum]|nr:serine-type D-Ala-D-Ala carboxypeptidase [Lactiplantibacillus plantarum]